MKKAISLSLALTVISLFCSSIQSQELIVIQSDFLKTNDSVLVFSPTGSCCNTEPSGTLFLLHGWSGSYKDWSKKYDIQAIADKWNFRIICPDGFYNGWYLNNIDKNKMQWRTFFDKELYPQMHKRYNFSSDNVFITGLSMGGHGAINIFIDDTSRFRAAGSMSGVLNLHHTNLKETHMVDILGEYPNNDLFTSSSAVERVETIKGTNKMMVISCGYEDVYAKSTREFAIKCKELGIPHFEILSPGNHSWKYWGFALDLHLWIFSRILNGENLGK